MELDDNCSSSVWFLEGPEPVCNGIPRCDETDLVKCPECGELYCEHGHLDCHGCDNFALEDLRRSVRKRFVNQADLRSVLEAWFSPFVPLPFGNFGIKPIARREYRHVGFYIEVVLIDDYLVDISMRDISAGRYMSGMTLRPIHMIFEERSELVVIGSDHLQQELTELRICPDGHFSVIQPPTL